MLIAIFRVLLCSWDVCKRRSRYMYVSNVFVRNCGGDFVKVIYVVSVNWSTYTSVFYSCVFFTYIDHFFESCVLLSCVTYIYWVSFPIGPVNLFYPVLLCKNRVKHRKEFIKSYFQRSWTEAVHILRKSHLE